MLDITRGIEILLIALVVALITRRTRRPYTIALVIWGLILGFLQLLEPVHLSKELVLVFFLPPLLFEGALHIRSDILQRRAGLIFSLSLVGSLLTALIVGYGAHLLLGLDLSVALLLGVIIAPTDPVSVLATFRNANVDRDLSTIVESESLFNDGIAVVLYVILLETIGGVELSILQGIGDIALVVGGGAVLGLGLGMLATRFLKRLDDHLIEVMITLVLVYGTYLLAEHLHLSGVIAVAIAGLVVGNKGLSRTSTYSRQSLTLFWEIVAFLVNSVAFLLIGFELQISRLVGQLLLITTVFAILLFARAIVVYSLGALSRWRSRNRAEETNRSELPWRWLHVIFFGGLRGAVPVALALGLPVTLTGRENLVTIVFGVVLFSLVGQGLTMPTLIRRLGLAHDEQIEEQTEQLAMEAAS